MQVCVFVKSRCFYSFTFNSQLKLKKNQQTILETFTKKKSPHNLRRFHCRLFELEILEIFTTAFFLKTVIWTWFFFMSCRAFSLKTKPNLVKKDASHLQIAWHNKRQKKNIEKRSQTTTVKQLNNNNSNYFLTFPFLCRKTYILLENIFGKTCFILLHLDYSFLRGRLLEMQ